MSAKTLICTAASGYLIYYCVLENEESKTMRQGLKCNPISQHSTRRHSMKKHRPLANKYIEIPGSFFPECQEHGAVHCPAFESSTGI